MTVVFQDNIGGFVETEVMEVYASENSYHVIYTDGTEKDIAAVLVSVQNN